MRLEMENDLELKLGSKRATSAPRERFIVGSNSNFSVDDTPATFGKKESRDVSARANTCCTCIICVSNSVGDFNTGPFVAFELITNSRCSSLSTLMPPAGVLIAQVAVFGNVMTISWPASTRFAILNAASPVVTFQEPDPTTEGDE